MKLITNYKNSRKFSRQLKEVIPDGAHTYFRGDDQFPVNFTWSYYSR